MGTCDVQALGVRQQNIIPDFLRPSNNTSAFDLSIQHLLGQSSVRHSAHMTKPPKPLRLQLRLNRKCMTPSQDFNIGHMGYPWDATDTPKTVHLKS